jgi:hypothetical protein
VSYTINLAERTQRNNRTGFTRAIQLLEPGQARALRCCHKKLVAVREFATTHRSGHTILNVTMNQHLGEESALYKVWSERKQQAESSAKRSGSDGGRSSSSSSSSSSGDGIPSTTMLLFHGTRAQNIDSICANGFDPSKHNGQQYGPGEYFGRDLATSLSYCKGSGQVLICEVVAEGAKEVASNIVLVADPSNVLPVAVATFS